jgi:type VI secretion system protein ImpH
METSDRARADLLNILVASGKRSRFFTSVQLLEQLFPEAARVGADGPPSKEAMRFRHDPGFAFAAGDLREIRRFSVPENDHRPAYEIVEIETTFLGLTGSSSPLPNYLAEQILFEDTDHPIRRDFLDVFHHRAVSLFYRGVARLSLPREHTADKTSVWVKRGLALGGVDAYEPEAGTRGLPPATLLALLPLLAGRARSARGLQTALRYVLRKDLGSVASVWVEQNVPAWFGISPEDQTALGRTNHALGRRVVLGTRAPDRAGKFAIRIGPLTAANYTRFLPGGDLLPLVRATVDTFQRAPLDFDLKLVVGADAVPSFALSTVRPASLGRTTWLSGANTERVVVVPGAEAVAQNDQIHKSA